MIKRIGIGLDSELWLFYKNNAYNLPVLINKLLKIHKEKIEKGEIK
jgi:hypothetical protein